MGVNPAERVRGFEGKLPGEHLKEQDSERVEVAAAVDGPVGAPGLFRRHVRERPLDELGRLRDQRLARDTRSEPELAQSHLVVGVADEHAPRRQVLVDEARAVHVFERRRDRDRDRKEARGIEWAPEDALERDTGEILANERGHALVGVERQRPQHLGPVQRAGNGQLVPQVFDLSRFFDGRFQRLEHDQTPV